MAVDDLCSFQVIPGTSESNVAHSGVDAHDPNLDMKISAAARRINGENFYGLLRLRIDLSAISELERFTGHLQDSYFTVTLLHRNVLRQYLMR